MMRVSGSSSSNLHNYLANQQDSASLAQQQQVSQVVVPSSPNREVPILRQSASRVTAFSSQYGGEESAFAYTAQNLAGELRIYPRYGDCSHAAVFRTFDRWWFDGSKLWLDDCFEHGVDPNDTTEDFVNLSYTTPVYLKAVEIYETFNVGHVTRIYAGYAPSPDEPVHNWTLLWKGRPDLSVGKAARAFVPPLHLERLNNQPVNAIRLEICSTGSEYYTELDAVYIHGYPVPNSVGKEQLYDPPSMMSHTLPKSPTAQQLQQSLLAEQEALEADLDYHASPSKLSSDCDGSGECKMLARKNLFSMWSMSQALSEVQRLSARLPTSPKSAAEQFHRRRPNLDSLPHELIHAIVAWLPHYDRTRTLSRLALVCKRLYAALELDAAMHDVADLRPVWHKVTPATLQRLASRADLTHARLSWLPAALELAPFFTALRSNRLQTLLLSCCQQVNDDLLAQICASQPQLRVVDLSGCRAISGPGFQALGALKQLRRLSLYRTLIGEQVLIGAVQQLGALEALDIGSLSKVSNMDAVLKSVAMGCPRLKALDCWRGKSLSHLGLRDLVEGCPELEELDLGWCSDIRSSTSIFRHVARQLPRLRRLLLTANRTVCDADLDAMATHAHATLEHVDILGCRDVTAAGVAALLERCSKLAFLDISFCASLDFDEVTQLRKSFPRCAIKKSYQP